MMGDVPAVGWGVLGVKAGVSWGWQRPEGQGVMLKLLDISDEMVEMMKASDR